MALEHTNPEPGLPERVVLIGGSGFVGRSLARHLGKADTSVVSFSSQDVDLSADGADEALADLLKPNDAAVLLAVITPDKGRGVDPFIHNIKIVANVAKALAACEPSHLIYFSSDAVYAMAHPLVRETTPAEPDNLYGAAHLSRELIVKCQTKTPVAVLRPTLIFGSEDTHDSYGPNRLRRMARDKGKITLFGNGEETRDHVFVDDVARLTGEVLRHRSQGLLNVATGQSISYYDLACRVAGLFDSKIEIEQTPRQNPITYRSFDITALRKAFPRFGFTGLDDGLAMAQAGMLDGAA